MLRESGHKARKIEKKTAIKDTKILPRVLLLKPLKTSKKMSMCPLFGISEAKIRLY